MPLPGNLLDVSTLVNKRKKIRNRGGRDAAMAAMKNLEGQGLGKHILKKIEGSMKVHVL